VWPFILQVPASIKTTDDLKGKKVGVSQFGSASDIATRVALRQLGLQPDQDVTIIQVALPRIQRQMHANCICTVGGASFGSSIIATTASSAAAPA